MVVFFASMIGVGLYCRKHSTDVNGFVLGGRSVGPWLTAFAYGTSYFSAVIFVGYAGQFGWNFGMASTWIGLGNAFIGSLLPWVILGRRTRVMTQHLESKTMPDFFGKRFDSNALKIAASVIVFVFLIPYTASLYNGLSSLFGIAFDIPYWVVIAVMAALTCAYVIFGGYMATAINDFIQGIIMLIGIVAVIAAVISDNGGFMNAYNSLATIETGTGMNGGFSSFLGPDPFFLFIVVLLTSLGTWGLPQMVGKFYSIKNEESIKKGTIISTIFAIIVAGGCYFLGGFGRLYGDVVTKTSSGGVLFDSIIPAMLKALNNDIIVGVVIVLVLAASMSTLSSLVLTSASTLALDVIAPKCKKEMSEKTKLVVLRVLILFFVVISAVIAILKDMFPGFTFIAQMMGVSWGALAGAFLAPFLYGLYWKKVTKPAVAVSFVLGASISVVQLFVTLGVITMPAGFLSDVMFKTSLHSGVFAMVGGLILVPVVSLITPKLDAEKVDDMFKCYDKDVVVPFTEHLGK